MASQLIPESSVEAAFPSVGFFVASLFIAESSFGARRPGSNIAQLQRVTIPERLEDGWFTENYSCLEVDQKYGTLLDDVDVVFHISEEDHVTEKKEEEPIGLKAFELI